MSILNNIRPELRALSPYSAAEQVEDTIRLNANESPFTAPNDTFKRSLNRYPPIRPLSIRKQMATRFLCDENQLLVTRGSSEAIDLLIRTFCRSGEDAIVISSPTFSMYAHYARVQNAVVIDAPLRSDFSYDVDAVCTRINDTTKLIFVCSPNNPSGTSVSEEDLRRVLATSNGRAGVVVDEAYIEFSPRQSLASLLDEYPNLIILRTLSKAIGFAGARCGAVIGQAELISVLDAVQAPYALATPVIESVESALKDAILDDCQRHVTDLVEERERMRSALSSLETVLEIIPSDANFLLVRFESPEAIMRATRNRNILLRHFGGELAPYIRISIGTKSENTRLLECLRELENTE